MTPGTASWPHAPDARHHPGFPAPGCSWTARHHRTLQFRGFWKEQRGLILLYHDGVDESHNVYGPHGAEAGQDGQQEVVFHFGPVQRGVCSDTRVAGQRRPRREGGVANGAGSAALPGLSVMGVGDGVLSPWWGGDDWRGAAGSFVDPITCTRDDKDRQKLSRVSSTPPLPPPQLQQRGQTRHLLLFSFSLMTMTRSAFDLLLGVLVPMSCSSPTWTESGAGWLVIREPSCSSSDGWSSPGHTLGHGITFTAMERAKQSALWSSLRSLKFHLRVTKK